MNRQWIIAGTIIAVGGAIFVGARITALHAAAVQQDSAICRAYLTNAAELPHPQALKHLEVMTVPGSQARLLSHWLAAEEGPLSPSFYVTSAHVVLSHVQLHGSGSVTLHAEATVTRHFYPRGSNQVEFYVNCLIQSAPTPKVEGVTVNTNPITTNSSPDAFNLNLWNLLPAAPTPHGD
ncbi:MAG: hypothetical protein OWU33_09410 [Firmicutes bacterium]|nr:hypothetical protein [Bacillota bacterium]